MLQVTQERPAASTFFPQMLHGGGVVPVTRNLDARVALV